MVEGAKLLDVLRVGEGQAREDVCEDIVLASLEFDLEVILREAKDPAIDPGGRGKISPKEIAKGCVICSQKEFSAEQEHSKVFDCANHCVEFDFIRSVIAL